MTPQTHRYFILCAEVYTCATPAEVGLYLWGKPVERYLVFDYECPYRFFTGDCALIARILETYEVRYVRHALPLVITQETVWNRGWRPRPRHLAAGAAQAPLCYIGTALLCEDETVCQPRAQP
jgi:hypothetical protein